jgi:hypothetical protein
MGVNMKFLTTLNFEIEFSLVQHTKLRDNNMFNEELQFLVDFGRGGKHKFSGSLKVKNKLKNSIVYNAIIDVKFVLIIVLFSIFISSVLFVLLLGFYYSILALFLGLVIYFVLCFKVKNDVKTKLFELSNSIEKTN